MPIGRIGTDFIVNTTTPNNQLSPSVTALPDGRLVVTWSSDEGGGGGNFDIRGRVYNDDGSPVANDFLVNTTTASSQSTSSVTALGDGRFLVTWQSAEGATGFDIRGRIFDADGTPVAPDFVVNTTTASNQFGPSATLLSDGRFLVTWDSDEGASSSDIRARFYNADASPVAPDFIVNTTTANVQRGPSVTLLPDGRFVLMWDSQEGGNYDIRARIYNTNGTPAGNDFIVNTTTANDQFISSLTALTDGQFVVTWSSVEAGAGLDVRARIYNANGSPTGNDFVVNTTTANDQISPSVTSLADGRFVVTWDSDEGGGQHDIRARLYNLDGTPAGNDFIVNTTTANNQNIPTITALADGRFVVAWGSNEGGSGIDIRAQIFDPTIFIGTSSDDVWLGGNLADRMHGYGGQDNLSGLIGDDRLSGDAGDDLLNGGNGIDWLFGGAGNDVLTGGLGRDVMSGGPGRDLFDFNSIKEAGKGANRDVIQEFQSGDNVTGDDIDLTGIDAKAAVKGNQAFKFVGTKAFAHHAGELRFADQGTICIVQGDVNGDGRADFEILVKIGTLGQGDFLL